jgi:MFS family permease
MKSKNIFSYENKLLVLLTFTFGFVLFDRMALNFMVPFFDKELGLNNTQIGLLASLLALAWAISGYVVGTLSDKTMKRKKYLLISVAVFSICSFISGIAASFAFLLVARIIMGFAEGPVLPLSQSIMATASTEKRRGFNMGFMQSFGSNLLGTMIAPLTLVALATNFGWRNAFFIAGIPGLLLAIIGYFVITERPAKEFSARQRQKASIADLLKYRNVWITLLLSGCMMTWMFAQITFLPKYLVADKFFSEENMGKTMAVFGLAALIWGAIVPALSDKLGRKPVVIVFFLLSMVMPLAVVYGENNFGSLAPLIFLGATTMGCFPIVLAIIPTETVPKQYLAQTMGFVMGIGELVGGFVAPAIAGWSADKFGLHAPFLIAAGAALIAALIAFLLIETAPAKVKKQTTILQQSMPDYLAGR